MSSGPCRMFVALAALWLALGGGSAAADPPSTIGGTPVRCDPGGSGQIATVDILIQSTGGCFTANQQQADDGSAYWEWTAPTGASVTVNGAAIANPGLSPVYIDYPSQTPSGAGAPADLSLQGTITLPDGAALELGVPGTQLYVAGSLENNSTCDTSPQMLAPYANAVFTAGLPNLQESADYLGTPLALSDMAVTVGLWCRKIDAVAYPALLGMHDNIEVSVPPDLAGVRIRLGEGTGRTVFDALPPWTDRNVGSADDEAATAPRSAGPQIADTCIARVGTNLPDCPTAPGPWNVEAYCPGRGTAVYTGQGHLVIGGSDPPTQLPLRFGTDGVGITYLEARADADTPLGSGNAAATNNSDTGAYIAGGSSIHSCGGGVFTGSGTLKLGTRGLLSTPQTLVADPYQWAPPEFPDATIDFPDPQTGGLSFAGTFSFTGESFPGSRADYYTADTQPCKDCEQHPEGELDLTVPWHTFHIGGQAAWTVTARTWSGWWHQGRLSLTGTSTECGFNDPSGASCVLVSSCSVNTCNSGDAAADENAWMCIGDIVPLSTDTAQIKTWEKQGMCSPASAYWSSFVWGGCASWQTNNGIVRNGADLALYTRQPSVMDRNNCDIENWGTDTGYSTGANSGFARAAGRRTPDLTRFKIPPHQPGFSIRFTGRGGAPKVRLTGPHGKTFTSPDRAGMITRSSMYDEEGDRTTVFLVAPSAGTWHVSALPGSAKIVGLEVARHGVAPIVRGRVTGRGRHRVLHLRYHAPAYDRIALVERGVRTFHALGAVHGHRCHVLENHPILGPTRCANVAFEAGPGLSGQRVVYATVTNRRTGRDDGRYVVGRFTAPPTPAPHRVRGLRVRRIGSVVVATWGPAAGAEHYVVTLRSSNLHHQLLRVVGRTRTAVFRDIHPATDARVTVIGVTGEGRPGPRRTIHLGPVAQHSSTRRREGNR